MIFVNLDRHFVTLLSTSCNVSFAISASRLSLRAPSTAGIDPPHGSGICEIHHSDRRTPCGIQLAAPPDRSAMANSWRNHSHDLWQFIYISKTIESLWRG